ncbi:MAG: glycosyltransferase family 39 protein, partial [Patescibacteria group bacterium]
SNFTPVGPAVMVALFGIATVYLVYKFSSEFFNKTVGLTAALLYSISPIVITYSRSSWNPNLMPFFSLLTLYVLYRGVKSENWKMFMLVGFLLGISMQLHYLAFFLGAIIAVYLLVTNLARFIQSRSMSLARVFVKDNLVIFTGFLVGLSPFIAFEARHNFANTTSIYSFILNSGDTGTSANFFSSINDVFFRLFARLVANFPSADQIGAGMHPNALYWQIFSLILAIVSVSILVLKLFKTVVGIRGGKALSSEFLKFSIIFVWIFIGIILFGFYKKPIYDYYFGFMFTLPFILTAFALNFIGSKNNALKIICILVYLSLVAVNLTGIPFRYSPNRQMNQMRTVAEFVLDKAEGKPFNFALITGGNSDHAYRYFFTLEGKPPVTIENTVVDPERSTVKDQLLVVCETACQPLGNSLWEVAGFGRAEIVDEWEVIVAKVYKLTQYREQ